MSVAEAIAGWARELSEVGGPNTLLWAPERRDGFLDLSTAHPGGVSMLLAGRPTSLSDLVREPAAFEEAREVARRIHAAAADLLAERGLVAGFVAIGVATWDPPRARAVVEAPVLLRPCRLRPVSAGETDFDLDLGPTVEVNPALVTYLRSVAGIEIDPVALAGLTALRPNAGHGSQAAGFDPYPVYAALGRLCADLPGFAVSPRLVVGSYPYAKPDMVADVGGHSAWLAKVDVVAALASDPEATRRLAHALPDPVADADPEQELTPLPLDPVQAAAVADAQAGRSHVLTAPLGTGRTQTLAALVAAAAYTGRRVLYVTPRRASLDALVERLGRLGLGDLVLDLTGAGADRSAVAAELSIALERLAELDDSTLARQAEPAGRVARATEAAERQDVLAEHVAAVHVTREPWGVTAYEIQEAMARLAARHPAPASRVRIDSVALQGIPRERVDELAEHLREAGEAGAWAADADGDPWYGADIRTKVEVDHARNIVTRLAGDGLTTATRELDGILAESTLPAARTALDWSSAFHTMRGVQQTLEVFRPEIFDLPLDEHVLATGNAAQRAAESTDLGWWSRSRVRRQARALLRPGRPPADLHAELISAREQRTAWHRLVGAGGRPEISPRLDEAGQLYEQLASDLAWLGGRLAGTDEGGDLLAQPLVLLRGRLTRLAGRLDRLEVLPRVMAVLEELRDAGMGELLDDLARRGVAPLDVAAEVEHVWWASLLDDVTRQDRRYAAHDGTALHAAARHLRELDGHAREVDAQRIRGAVDLRARIAARENPRQTDLLHAQAATASTGPGLPFADLFRETEQLLTALRPCLAVSPYALARILAPGSAFDLVVVDDAASLTVAESVSALSRGRAVVVVADPAGPAPSSFRVGPGPLSTGPGATGSTGPTSLYAAAWAVLPERRLDVRHAPVDARLALPGAADGLRERLPGVLHTPSVRLRFVEGSAAVQPGSESAIEWTEAEVEAIVGEVVEHARRSPGRSLAVVALTGGLAERVRHGIREAIGRLDDDPTAAVLLAGTGSEPLVVASLDRFAPTLRDVVIVGVGYGRTPHGRVLHRFPTLADDAADRALLAATACAREDLLVFSTLRAADLDPSRLRTAGTQRLRSLLEHAEHAEHADNAERAGEGGTGTGLGPNLGYLAARLRQEGLTVDELVPGGSERIALAVGHRAAPGRWLVAVEDDGAEYAAHPGVRARDLTRPELFERSGWRHVQVWSTDLFRDPAREVARIVGIVQQARRALDPGRVATPAEGGPEPAAAPATAGRGRSDLDRHSDDSDLGWGERRNDPDGESAHDQWLQEQRPPHWE